MSDTQIYKVRDPSGTIREIRGPAGASDDEVIAQAKALFSTAPAAPTSPVDQIPGYGKPVPAGQGAAPSQPDTLLQKGLGLIEAPIALGAGAAMGAVAPIVGVGATLASGKYGTQEGIRAGEQAAQRVQGMAYQPRTQTGQNIVQGIGNALNASGVMGVPLPLMNDLARSVGPAARAVGDATRSEGSLIKGAVSVPLEARAAQKAAAQSAKSWENANQIEAAQKAQELGIALNPAISNPTGGNRVRSMLAGNTDANAKLSKMNEPVFTNLAKKEMGLPTNSKLDSAAFEKARQQVSGPYDQIKAIPQLVPDGEVLASIESLRVPELIGGADVAGKVARLVDDAVSKVNRGLTGDLAVTNIRQLRRDAQAIYNAQKKGNAPSPEQLALADVNMGIADALESLVESNISNNPRLLGDFRAARTAMAKTYAYEKATDLNTGKVDPLALAKLTAANDKLTGTIADIGKVAGNFPEIAGQVSNQTFLQRAQPHINRAGVGGTLGFAAGLAMGQPALGAILGGAAGEVAGALGTRRIASGAYQAAHAVPKDNRIFPPAAPIPPTNNLPAVYDWRNALLPEDQVPNFTIPQGRPDRLRPNQVPPGWMTPEQQAAASRSPQLPAPNAADQTASLAGRRAFDYNMAKTLEEQAAAAQAAKEAAGRQPTRGGQIFELDPVTGRLRSASEGVKGATPEIFMADTGSSLRSAAEKMATGQTMHMTAAEKVAWNKTKVDFASVAPEFERMSERTLVGKMQDRQWVQSVITKAREKAAAFDEIAIRADRQWADGTTKKGLAEAAASRGLQSRMAEFTKKARDAVAERDRMMAFADSLEQALSKSRPVSTGGQGKKTREFNRNRLVSGDNRNALTQ